MNFIPRKHGSLAVLVVALAAFTIAGCGGSDDGDGGGGGDGSVQTKKAGTLTIATSAPYPPFEVVRDGELTGFDVEMANEIAKRMDLKPEVVNTPFDTIFTSLAAGRFDLVAAATGGCAAPDSPFLPTQEQRARIVGFSDPYFLPRQVMVGADGARDDLQTVDDLADGDRVGVLRGTVWVDYGEAELAPRGVEIVQYRDPAAMITALDAGSIDVAFEDELVFDSAGKEFLDTRSELPANYRYVFGVPKDDPALADAVNGAITEILDDGTYDRLFTEWFPKLERPSNEEISVCPSEDVE